MKKPNKITDIFFDLDHTLWDFEKNSALTFEKIFGLNAIEVDLPLFLEHYIPINFKYWKLYREEKISKEALRFSRLNDTFMAIKKPVEQHKIEKLSHDYIIYLTTFNHLITGALEVLAYLEKKYKLHIITNGFNEVQQTKLDKSGITKYFHTITNSELAGVKKPNPKIFQYALNVAKVNVGNAIMIGDSYEADIEGALNIGMDAIYLKIESTETHYGVKTISNLYQLMELL